MVETEAVGLGVVVELVVASLLSLLWTNGLLPSFLNRSSCSGVILVLFPRWKNWLLEFTVLFGTEKLMRSLPCSTAVATFDDSRPTDTKTMRLVKSRNTMKKHSAGIRKAQEGRRQKSRHIRANKLGLRLGVSIESGSIGAEGLPDSMISS